MSIYKFQFDSMFFKLYVFHRKLNKGIFSSVKSFYFINVVLTTTCELFSYTFSICLNFDNFALVK